MSSIGGKEKGPSSGRRLVEGRGGMHGSSCVLALLWFTRSYPYHIFSFIVSKHGRLHANRDKAFPNWEMWISLFSDEPAGVLFIRKPVSTTDICHVLKIPLWWQYDEAKSQSGLRRIDEIGVYNSGAVVADSLDVQHFSMISQWPPRVLNFTYDHTQPSELLDETMMQLDRIFCGQYLLRSKSSHLDDLTLTYSGDDRSIRVEVSGGIEIFELYLKIVCQMRSTNRMCVIDADLLGCPVLCEQVRDRISRGIRKDILFDFKDTRQIPKPRYESAIRRARELYECCWPFGPIRPGDYMPGEEHTEPSSFLDVYLARSKGHIEKEDTTVSIKAVLAIRIWPYGRKACDRGFVVHEKDRW
jgi:hypothetical protein